MSYYCPHCRVRFYSGDERCECRATLVLEGGAPTGDHHAADRGRPVRTPHEIWEHINADHPCCIGVGDAVSLLKENEGLRAIITRWQRRDLKKATMPSEVREDGAKEVERLRAAMEIPKEYIVVSERIWKAREKAIKAALAKIPSCNHAAERYCPWCEVRQALKGERALRWPNAEAQHGPVDEGE